MFILIFSALAISAEPQIEIDFETQVLPILQNRCFSCHSAPKVDANGIVSAGDDRTVRFWQPTIGRMVKFARLEEAPLDTAWLNDGSKVVAVCTDGAVRFVDPDSVEVTSEIHELNGWAYSLAVHPTDGSVVVGDQNAQVRRIIPQ